MKSLATCQEKALCCLSAEEQRIDSHHDVKVDPVEHPWFLFVRKGAVRVALEQGDVAVAEAGEGDVLAIPSDVSWRIGCRGRRNAGVLLIGFQSADTSWLAPSRGRLLQFRMPHVEYWVRDFLHGMSGQHTAAFFHVQSHLYALGAEAMEAVERAESRPDGVIDSVLRLKRTMVEQPWEKIDIEETARLLGLSVTKFYQLFKSCTGFSPLRFLTMARLNASLRLLANREDSIKAVANEVGYPDELYFSRLFRKQMGLTPSEYAACTRKRVASLSGVLRGDLATLGIEPVLELPKGWADGKKVQDYLHEVKRCAPDLIVSAPLPEELVAQVAQIAPVHIVPWKGRPWKENLCELAGLFGITGVAERWLDWFAQKVAHVRDLLQEQYGDETFLIASAGQLSFRIHGVQRLKFADLFYQELQVAPPGVVQGKRFFDVSSLEEVEELGCDHVFLLTSSTLSPETVRQLERSHHHYILLQHDEPLLYNSAFYQSLVDRLAEHLLIAKA